MNFRLKPWATRLRASLIGATIGLLGGLIYMGSLTLWSIIMHPDSKMYAMDAVVANVAACIVGAVFGALAGLGVREGLKWAASRGSTLPKALVIVGAVATGVVALMWIVLALTLSLPPIVTAALIALAAGAIAAGIGRIMVSPLGGAPV
ncbi:hypothetical protein LWF01_14845 [Saxibacter everestensis]|uniref:Fluoride ion transporter CrcB n=1 Tax=Saxibacter everestensis TaxID=2909229 RepID=A0ABY8QSK8_9MICO|nr:hypothetical protein LWF01_14845 [Brevibacteriaceae bacterium ZFBP1038]